MTAVDPTTQRLAEMRDRSEKATPGPWGTYAAYGSRGVEVTDSEDMVFIQDGGITYAVHEADAEFITHARTDLDALRGAVEDVLALHRPKDRAFDACCVGCWEAGGEDGAPSWPCPTVTAITKRLGGA
jgi:hypothetical protein